MKRIKNLLLLFILMFKIGLFTFGGGYAMIHILEDEFVSKRKWLEDEEFSDLVVIAESTPGPIAINCSTYIGYKQEKILGSIFSTLGVCLPSFIIIYLISLFFNQFLDIEWVSASFKGIQICVIFLILSAGIKMYKKLAKTPFNITLLIITLTVMILLELLGVNFSSIFYIIIAAFLGLLTYFINLHKNRNNKEDK